MTEIKIILYSASIVVVMSVMMQDVPLWTFNISVLSKILRQKGHPFIVLAPLLYIHPLEKK